MIIFDVCCVGHMCTDVLIRPVSSLPEKGKLKLVDSIHLKTGGCAMNTSIGLAKLGVKTALVGKVGKDGFGEFMRATLQEKKVFAEKLAMQEDGMTSASVVTIDEDGERTIMHCLGTNGTLCLGDIDTDVVLSSKILFVGGVFLMPAFDGGQTQKLLELAQKNYVLTAMDTAWDATGKWLDTLRPCLAHLDWFLPSIEEAEQLLGLRNEKQMAVMLKQMGVRNVAIKMGSEGCYVEPQNERGEYFPCYPVRVTDTAGAGDAWCAGFLAGLTFGYHPFEAACIGNAAGALCVREIGTTAGIEDLDQTLAFMKENA